MRFVRTFLSGPPERIGSPCRPAFRPLQTFNAISTFSSEPWNRQNHPNGRRSDSADFLNSSPGESIMKSNNACIGYATLLLLMLGTLAAAAYVSQVTLPITAGGAATESSIGRDANLQMGYASVTVNSGSVPYATAIVSYAPNGIVSSEVGIPASPPTKSARLFVEYRSGVASGTGTVEVNTGIAAVNTGSSSALVNLALRDLGGSSTPMASGSFQLAAGAHIARFINQFGSSLVLPSNFPASIGFATLEITSDQALSIMALRMTTNQRNESLYTSTPIADLSNAPATDSLDFPQVADGGGYQTTLVLMNTSDSVETGSIRLRNDRGAAMPARIGGSEMSSSQLSYQIPSKGALRLQTDGSPSDVTAGWAQLVPASGSTPVAAGIIDFTLNGILTTESGVSSSTPTTHARIYIDQSSGHDTGLAITAADSAALDVTLQAYGTDGITAAGDGSGTINLAGYGHRAAFVDELISGLPDNFTGVLDIHAPTPFAVLTLRSLVNERSDYLIATFPTADVTASPPSSILFPQITAGGGYKTEFVFLNTGTAGNITLRYLDDSGAAVAIGPGSTSHGISGTVGGDAASGVTLTLSGSGSGTVVSDSSGQYSFANLSNGTYTVTPSLSGYTFSPASSPVTIADAEVTSINFTATKTYGISGTISGAVKSGVSLTLSGAAAATTTSASSGTYSFAGLSNGVYTVTPAATGYAFSPASTTTNISGADVTRINFTSTSVTTQTGDRTDYSSISVTSGGAYSSGASGVSKQYYEYTSTVADTPAIKVAPGGSLTLTHSKATKSGSTSSTENSGFYGFNSGVLASASSSATSYRSSSAASLTMTDGSITTNATGANGAFAFGEDAVVNLDHVTITTTGDSNSRGVDATYGGTVNISNSRISTVGGSSAALATDRYENYSAPKINATNVVGTTAGAGSPGIYSTGMFTVADSALTATGSEAAVIEGLNSIKLTNTSISGTKKWGVMIYQSMSGDSSAGTGTFTMTGGSITNNSSGPLFFICNTKAVITLNNAMLNNSSGTFLKASTAAAANDSNVNSSWGKNGGTVLFTAINQAMTGNILIMESSSSVSMDMSSGSVLTGAINGSNVGTANVVLDSTSQWTATSDSYVSKLTLARLDSLDAQSGVTITVTTLSGVSVTSPYTLASGGRIIVK
jgi:hypothetical protein